MRLVHREQTYIRRAQKGERIRVGQPFGRKIEQAQASAFQLVANFCVCGGVLIGVQRRRAQAAFHKLLRLVAHQRDQGRHDDRQAGARHGGQLIYEGFAAAGWPEGENILPIEQRRYGLGLARQKIVEAEFLRQDFSGGVEVSHGACRGRQSEREPKSSIL